MPPPPPDRELPADLAEALAGILLGPVEGRDARLAEFMAAHAEHATAIEQMSRDIRDADRLLAQSFPDGAATAPVTIGRYRVSGTLGEGAFGTVYLCSEDEPVRREVAVKLLRPGAGDRQTLQRFASERQLLAELNHPAIVRVLDAGAAADGRPFFVMDRVDGLPITAYADLQGLTLRQRIELFVAVCRGVQHAHARGIVHRDLKPANVLVAEIDGQPAPRIIDFGIAKSLTVQGERPLLATESGRMIGTPGYMSPEQREGTVKSDARSDVFALGVMLYELLVGERPWEPGDSTIDREAPQPSRHRSKKGADGTERTRRQLRGDLDWIVVKALQANRELRYANAGELASDLELHLAGAAIAACRPSTVARARRVLRRHRAMFLGLLAVVSLAGGLGLAEHFRREALASEKRRVDQALQIADRLLERATAASEDADDTSVHELLRESIELRERVLAETGERFEVRYQELRTLHRLACSQFLFGEYEQDVTTARRALALALQLAAQDPSPALRHEVANAHREIGRASYLLGDFETGRTSGESAVAGYEELHASEPFGYDKLYAKSIVEYASSIGRLGDEARQVELQRRAIDVLVAFVAARPSDMEAQRDLVRFRCGLSNQLLRRRDVTAAAAMLELAEADVGRFALVTDEERALVAMRTATLRTLQGRKPEAITAGLAAVGFGESLVRRHPQRAQERVNLIDSRRALIGNFVATGDHAAAEEHISRLAADAKSSAPTVARSYVRGLVDISRALLGASRIAALPRMASLLADAVARTAAFVTKDGKFAELQVEAGILRATMLAECGTPMPATELQMLVEKAKGIGHSDFVSYGQWLSAVTLLDAGEIEGATAASGALERDQPSASQAVDLRLRLATARADVHGVEVALADAVALRAPVERARFAGLAACALVELQGAAARGLAEVTAARALGEEFLSKTPPPADPYDVARSANEGLRDYAWARVAVLVAQLATDPAQADELRRRALPVLDAMRGKVGALGWSEAMWIHAHRERLARLLAGGHTAAMLTDLRAWAATLHDARGCEAFCEAAAACVGTLDAAAAETVDRLAARVLETGVAAGLTGRRHLADSTDLLPLVARPCFATALAKVPE